MMDTVILKDGFTVEADADALDDAELFELILDIDAGRSADVPRVLAALLGAEGKKALYDHLREESGRVRLTAVTQALSEIFTGLQSKKKSSSTPA